MEHCLNLQYKSHINRAPVSHYKTLPLSGHTAVGCLSVCCEYVLLSLVSKEAAVAYGKEEWSQEGNPRDREER